MSRPAKGGYHRVVIWGKRTGFVLDVGGWQALRASTPASREETFQTGAGRRYVTDRENEFSIPLIHSSLINHAALMQRSACEVQMIALGFKRHLVWLSESNIELEEARGGVGGFAAEIIRLFHSSVFPAISGSDNLLDFAPWNCTDAVLMNPEELGCGSGSGGSGSGAGDEYGDEGYYLTTGEIGTGFNGPLWKAQEGASVDGIGALSGVTSPALIEFRFPLGGAVLRLESNGVVGTLSALSGTGSVLSSAGAGSSFFVPGGTWKLRVEITSASLAPFLSVVKYGNIYPPRHGVCVPCEAYPLIEADDPTANWDIPPYIICPGKTCYSLPSNEAPYLVSEADVCLSDDGDGFARFELEIRDDNCDDIEITLIDFYRELFTIGGPPNLKERPGAGVFNYFEGSLFSVNCGAAGSGSGSGSGGGSSYTSKTISFEIALAGTICEMPIVLFGDEYYTLVIEFNDGANTVSKMITVRCPGDELCSGSGSGS